MYGVGNFCVLMCWSNLDRVWWWNPLCTTIWAFYCTECINLSEALQKERSWLAWPESLESAAGRNFWWLHYLLINCLTKINFLYCADISNVIRPIVTSSPRQSSNQVWKQFAHFDFSRTVEPPSLWMHFPVRTFPTLRTGSFPSFSHGLPSCI